MASPTPHANAKRMRSDSSDGDGEKRPRVDESMHDDENHEPNIDILNYQGLEIICQQARFSLEMLEEVNPLSDFLEAGLEQGVSAFGEKYNEFHQKRKELNQIFVKFNRDLNNKYQEIENSMETVADVVGKHERWWELMNIFSPYLGRNLLRALQKQSVPTTVDYANYIRKHMDIIWDADISFNNMQEDWFFQLIEEEIRRVFDMSNGAETWIAAAQLTIKAKTDIIQSPTQTILDNNPTLLRHHSKYTQTLEQMMAERFDELRYINAADACRKVRERMNRHKCAARGEQKCVFNTLLRTLEILQKRAEYEVRHTAMLAVGTLLPVELTNLVLEYTLLAEEVPSDPRIFVPARNNVTGQIGQKLPQVWYFGPDWVEIRPDYVPGEDGSDW